MMGTALAATETTFTALVEGHRRELHGQCYRLLGSFVEAEDLVQETLLRAWRNRERMEPGDNFRAWLYKIATNVCIDKIRHDRRRVPSFGSFRDIPWLQPYPDRLLAEITRPADDPDAAVVGREGVTGYAQPNG